jgi:hypothetical protein
MRHRDKLLQPLPAPTNVWQALAQIGWDNDGELAGKSDAEIDAEPLLAGWGDLVRRERAESIRRVEEADARRQREEEAELFLED